MCAPAFTLDLPSVVVISVAGMKKARRRRSEKMLSTTFDCQFKTAFQVILIFNIPSAVVNSGAENEKAKKMK